MSGLREWIVVLFRRDFDFWGVYYVNDYFLCTMIFLGDFFGLNLVILRELLSLNLFEKIKFFLFQAY